MGRSKASNNRAAGGNNGGVDSAFAHRSQQDAHDVLKPYWGIMPDGSKNFLAATNTVDFHQLVTFWSSLPLNLHQAEVTCSMCTNSWYLALNYLRLGEVRVAKNLILNGGFLQEAYCTPMSDIVQSPRSGSAFLEFGRYPDFHAAHCATSSPATMREFLRDVMPTGNQRTMRSKNQRTMTFASQTKQGVGRSASEFAELITNDWQEGGRSSNPRNASRAQEKDAEIISIVLRDDDANEEIKLQVGCSTMLKVLFNDYAELRGLSLRSFRFSYEGRTLFLSAAKNKTPEQLGMSDLAVIAVTHISPISKEKEASAKSVGSSNGSNPQRTSPRKKKGKKSKKGKKRAQPYATEKTQEELKIEHSKKLTKIHEEAQPRFKQIRQRLNNLSIERNLPKSKPRRPKLAPPLPEMIDYSPPSTGGKAGRSHYVVNVGEVQNLYKTSKSRRGPAASPRGTSVDLHGLTKAQALDLLDEKLPQWNDAAMSGSYPFVIPVEIVCGGGNQILSEAVEKWIRRNDTVSNAPKNVRVPQRHCPCP